MPSERDNATEFLAALGWLTVCWGRVEAYIDLISAYLSESGLGKKPPRPFSARIKYIRIAMNHFAFTPMRDEIAKHLSQCLELSLSRNDLVHGVMTGWFEGGSNAMQLKATSSGYVAIQDISITTNDIDLLSDRVQELSCFMFGWLERIKSVLRVHQGRDDFNQVARLNGDRE